MSKGAYKSVASATTVGGAIQDAFAMFQELRDEMSENASNMEGTGLENTQKYADTVEARDTLEQFADNDVEVPDSAEGLAVSVHQQMPTRKGRNTSRTVRYSNAVALLEAARDAVETARDLAQQSAKDFDDQASEYEQDAADEREAGSREAEEEASKEAALSRSNMENSESEHDELDSLFDELENVIGDASAEPNFPGMYG